LKHFTNDTSGLNNELANSEFLAGDHVTAADTMVLFSIQFIFARDLSAGRKASEWKNVERWIKDCENTESYKRAVKKTGHEM
jgi:glutathione S-transferase